MKKQEFKEIRAGLSLSQRKLALVLKRNYRTIQRYESGYWPVSIEIAKLMRELLNIKNNT